MEILKLLFGEHTLITWLFCSIFALVGFVLYKLLLYKKRSEKCTPFDIRFWWEDNKIEFLLGLTFFWLMTRFHEDISEAINSQFSLPIIKNLLLFNFLFGLLFQVGAKKLRGYFRLSENALGEERNPTPVVDTIEETNGV